jgi:uncharacterized delta-60 repeat protein
LIAMLRSLALTSLAALALTAAPASAAVAPGRIAFLVSSKVPESNVDAGGYGPAVVLPDGGAILVVANRSFRGITVVRLRPDGSPEPAFGRGGTARVALPGSFSPRQLLRQPDGRLLVVGDSAAASKYELPRVVLVRLTAAGALDPTFGSGGVAVPGLQSGNDSAALAPDGSIVVTGTAGQVSPEIERDPSAPASFRWVVQRLTPAGATDAGFGTVTIPGPAGHGTSGYGTVVRPDGAIVVLGTHSQQLQLAGLTAAGAPDPAFNGGAPLALPTDGFQMLLHAHGAIDVVGYGRLVRVTTSGALDTAYGSGGTVTFGGFPRNLGPPKLLAAPDGGTILHRLVDFDPTPAGQPRLHVQRITPSGALGAASDLSPAFGGGFGSTRRSTAGGIEQNSFAGELLPRPDGSYLIAGGVKVGRYTGEGAGFSAGLVAVAAYTPLLAPDASFGGPQQEALARVRIPRQRARVDAELRRVLARVTASGPGLVLLRVRDGRRRVLASVVAPVYAAGTTNVRVPLTATGRRVLRRARTLGVRVGHEFRDVLTGRDRGTTPGRLR